MILLWLGALSVLASVMLARVSGDARLHETVSYVAIAWMILVCIVYRGLLTPLWCGATGHRGVTVKGRTLTCKKCDTSWEE